MVELKKKVTEYQASLKHCGVKDWEVKNLDTSILMNIVYFIKSAIFVMSFCTIVRSN